MRILAMVLLFSFVLFLSGTKSVKPSSSKMLPRKSAKCAKRTRSMPRAKIKYYLVRDEYVVVKYDKHNRRHHSKVFATNRPDIYKPNHTYGLSVRYWDKSGLKSKTIIGTVLDKPAVIGGQPNLELCLYKNDTAKIDFVKEHLNGKTVKVWEVL